MSNGIRPFAFNADTGLEGSEPWLVLGKGPTASSYSASLAHTHQVFALNHAMRGCRAKVGHAVDIEVFDDFTDDDLAGVEYLCLPWIPHARLFRPLYPGKVFFGPGALTLPQHCAQRPLLARYQAAGRLLSYNLCSAPAARHNPALLNIEGRSFSAAIAVRLLAEAGARTIHTLGVDGGSAYAASFADIAAQRRLQTAQTSFDSQFQEIADSIRRFGLHCGPLDQQIPAQVFVGCMPEQDLAYRVLEYSIHRHASISVQVQRLHTAIAMQCLAVPQPRDLANRGRTPFSFQRFAIPALCGHQGRAIYLDSDMLVLRDLRPVWGFPLGQRQLASVASPPGSSRAPQFSVMLLDCARLPWRIESLVAQLDAGTLSYQALMHDMATVPHWEAALPPHWNSLEEYDPAETSLVHFTDMNGQPWLNPLHPHAALWCRYLLDAVAERAIPETLIAEEVQRGHIRPSLLVQLARGEPNPLRLPYRVLRDDHVLFMPVHLQQAAALTRWRFEWQRNRALLRHGFEAQLRQPLANIFSKIEALGRKWLTL